jgi:hypothetical protein
MVNVSVPSGGSADQRIMFILNNLNRGSTFEVQVAAFTAVGAGPLADAVTIVTIQG